MSLIFYGVTIVMKFLSSERSDFQKAIMHSQRGFSLIEILIALTLLGIVGTFVATNIFSQLQEGQVKATTIQMGNFGNALKEFRRKCAFYPTTDQGLAALLSKPTSGRECKAYPPNGILEESSIPQDPWGFDYEYTSDGKSFQIRSYGPDGEFDTEDDIIYPAKG